MCGPICLAAIHLLSEGLAHQPIEEVCRQLRNESAVLSAIDLIYDPIKNFRAQYYRTHRFEFNKNPQEAHRFMRHTVDSIDLNHVLKCLKTKVPAIQAIQKVVVPPTESRTEHENSLV